MSESLAIRGVLANTYDEIWKIAETCYKAGIVPRGCGSPAAAFAIIAMGKEVGLAPIQSLQNIMLATSKNGGGRLSIWGDAMLALVRKSGQLKSIKERIEGDGDDRTATCIVHRVGDEEPRTFTFSMADARKAKLADKAGPWQEYPDRQLTMRARSWALRDVFTDVLCGLAATEEVNDTPDVIVSQAAPATEPTQSPAKSAEVTAEVMIADEQLAEIASLRGPFVYMQAGVRPEDGADKFNAAWKGLLKKHVGPDVESAKQLTSAQADALLVAMKDSPAASFL